MDQVMQRVKEMKGCNMGRGVINILCGTDDVILIAENEDDLSLAKTTL